MVLACTWKHWATTSLTPLADALNVIFVSSDGRIMFACQKSDRVSQPPDNESHLMEHALTGIYIYIQVPNCLGSR